MGRSPKGRGLKVRLYDQQSEQKEIRIELIQNLFPLFEGLPAISGGG